jgi:Carboxypeptidase regulatory-like domain
MSNGMTNRVFFWVMAYAFALFVPPVLYGQTTGGFSGNVLDQSGSGISGATVIATSQATGVARESRTDDSGHYLIPLLLVGIYTLHVESAGFQTVEAKDVRLQVDEERVLDLTLALATVAFQVEVPASVVAVETTNPSLGQVITAQQVAQLPLNGRDFVQLATLTPGTTQETSTSSFFNGGANSEVSARGSFSLSVGGSRANSTDWLLDGNDNNELTAGGIAVLSSIDSIQEFKVLTYNYSAEYGARAGPTVLVTTKSGSNDFHGSLFEFLRNTSLDARSFFAVVPEKFNLNQFGGSIGGPLRKSRAFFYLDGEQKYQRKGITFTGLVPTQAMRNGDFSADSFGNQIPLPTSQNPLFPGAIVNPNVSGASTDPAIRPNVYFQCDASGNAMLVNADGSQASGANCYKIPAGLINPIAAQMIGFYPLPNTTNGGIAYNFVSEPVRKLDETKFDIRLDYNFSRTDNAFGRFSYDQATSYVPGGAPGFAEQGAFASNQGIINHARNIAVSESHVFSSTTVNQVSGGYNRIFNYITSQGSGSCEAARIGISGANLDCDAGNVCSPVGTSCGLTSTLFDGGYWALGDRGFSPFTGGTNVYSVSDSLDLIRGKHDIKIGGSIRANQMNVRTEGFQDGFWLVTGLWTNNPEADFLLGLPSLAIHDQTFKGDVTGRRWKMFRPYVQDDWRVTKNLTLNLGLAWNLTTPISEAHDRQANFDPATAQFLIAGQGAGNWAGIQFDKSAFEPRIGFAWKPGGSDKTAVRAGYAIYHDSSWSQGAQGLWQNPPYYAESDRFAFGGSCTFAMAACSTVYGSSPSAISLSDGFQIFSRSPIPADFTGTIQAQNTNFKLGRVQQFNANLEHQFLGEIILTVGYAGSRSSHILIDGNNLNVTSPSACGIIAGYTRGCGQGESFVGLPYVSFPFSTISNISDQGQAHYDSLQIRAETKSSRYGVYALIGYAYSRTYDNGFSDALGTTIGATYYPLPNWEKLDWALSQINLDHNFTASVIYDLPFGRGKRFGQGWNGRVETILGKWQVTLIQKLTSGFPVFVVDSFNQSGVNFQNNGNSLNRPDVIGDPSKAGVVSANPGCAGPAQLHTTAAWFNPCAFAFVPVGQLGDASRTPLSGPSFVNTDFSVIKQFALPWERVSLNFRAEFFNLFNHPQLGLPVTPGTGYADIDARNFGAISSTVNNPRVVQFGVKLTF